MHYRKGLRVAVMLFFVMLVGMASIVSTPVSQADDRSYTIQNVSIDATIAQDGALNVTEQRRYSFWGHFNGVFQKVGDFDGGGELQLHDASVICGGYEHPLSNIPFESAWRSDPKSAPSGHYSFDKKERTFYVFMPMENEYCDITFSYSVAGAVKFYDDTSELYWQFVAEEWDVENRNIDVTVTLPIPRGESAVAGNNVYLFGHGSDPRATINLFNGRVKASVPSVSPGDFAELRVFYPREWGTPKENASNVFHKPFLDKGLADERGSKVITPLSVGAGVVSIATLIFVFRDFLPRRNNVRPKFKEKYWRESPDRDVHPAVVGRLWQKSRFLSLGARYDIAASVMRLSNMGAIRLTPVNLPTRFLPLRQRIKLSLLSVFGRSPQHNDYVIQPIREHGRTLDPIDKEVMAFLFDRESIKSFHSTVETLQSSTFASSENYDSVLYNTEKQSSDAVFLHDVKKADSQSVFLRINEQTEKFIDDSTGQRTFSIILALIFYIAAFAILPLLISEDQFGYKFGWVIVLFIASLVAFFLAMQFGSFKGFLKHVSTLIMLLSIIVGVITFEMLLPLGIAGELFDEGDYFPPFVTLFSFHVSSLSLRAIAGIFTVTHVVFLILSFFPSLITHPTEKGREIVAKSKALKRWLKDFTLLNERPVEDVKVWGELMVYALMFGVAEKVAKQLDMSTMGVQHDERFAALMEWVSSSSGSSGAFDSLTYSSGHILSSYSVGTISSISSGISNFASSGSGYSSGGGGGFSGGGGGGGGSGGGGGAF